MSDLFQDYSGLGGSEESDNDFNLAHIYIWLLSVANGILNDIYWPWIYGLKFSQQGAPAILIYHGSGSVSSGVEVKLPDKEFHVPIINMIFLAAV